ncbi:MAG: hypothetical protein JHC87_02785 [Thermoleophilaceae bacterium]|nr:hypothetical protein [Thermoleophilaceae bacterium]
MIAVTALRRIAAVFVRFPEHDLHGKGPQSVLRHDLQPSASEAIPRTPLERTDFVADGGPNVRIAVLDLSGRERWLCDVIAAQLAVDRQSLFAFSAGGRRSGKAGRGVTSLRLGSGKLRLPFATRRRGAVWQLSDDVCVQHRELLDTLGPVVKWVDTALLRNINELETTVAGCHAVVLVRRASTTAEYSLLVAEQLAKEVACGPVVRVLIDAGPRTTESDLHDGVALPAIGRPRLAVIDGGAGRATRSEADDELTLRVSWLDTLRARVGVAASEGLRITVCGLIERLDHA